MTTEFRGDYKLNKRVYEYGKSYQMNQMQAFVHFCKNGGEVLISYNTPVVYRAPNGSLVFDSYWLSRQGSMTTKKHISTYVGLPITEIRAHINEYFFEVDNLLQWLSTNDIH